MLLLKNRIKNVVFLILLSFFLLASPYFNFSKAEGIKYGTVEFLTPTPTPIVTPTPTQSISQTPSQIPSKIPSQSPFPSPTSYARQRFGKYVYFSQCDANLGSRILPNGCSFCAMGCGPTTLAMALSNSRYNLKKRVYTPIEIAEMFRRKKLYLGCQAGSYIIDFPKILASFGYRKFDIISLVNSRNPLKLLSLFKKAKWEQIVLFEACSLASKRCFGHYVYLVNVNSRSLYALDPFYGKRARRPIDVLNMPGVKIKLQFALIFKP